MKTRKRKIEIGIVSDVANFRRKIIIGLAALLMGISLNLKRFNLYYDWEPGNEYEFSVDSTAFHGIYGLFTDKIKQGFKVRKLEEYASITFLVTGADSTAFVELLDAQDKVVRRRSLTDGGYADFYFLNPGKYCARLVNDRNGNGIWDTGNFEKGEQPEEVYYYNMILEPKANWDLDKQSTMLSNLESM